MKKALLTFALLMTLTLCLTASLSLTAFAEENALSFNLRIEGINETLYYSTVSVPYEESLSLQDALLYLDANDDSLSFTGADSDYITEINGEAAGSFGGWDGWLFTVNGTSLATAMSSCILNENDKVVLYYGDPYGIGMQFPNVEIKEGKLLFTSANTVYDESFNPTVVINPVVSATVSINGETFVTDENGEISLEHSKLKNGANSISISKNAENGCPMLLRFAPDFTLELETENDTVSSEAPVQENSASSGELTETPEAGDNGVTAFAVLAIFSFLSFVFVAGKRKNEA